MQLRHRTGLVTRARAMGEAGRRRAPHRRVTYVLAGPLRWVEPDVPRALLRVDATNPAARRFNGRTLTVDLEGTHIVGLDHGRELTCHADDLTAGHFVTVRLRLPRHLAALPDVVHPRALVALD